MYVFTVELSSGRKQLTHAPKINVFDARSAVISQRNARGSLYHDKRLDQ